MKKGILLYLCIVLLAAYSFAKQRPNIILVCSPGRSALLTGKCPARLQITDWIQGHKRPHARLLPPDWTIKYTPDYCVFYLNICRRF